MEEYVRFAESLGRFLAEALSQDPELVWTPEFISMLKALALLEDRIKLRNSQMRNNETLEAFRKRNIDLAQKIRKKTQEE